MVLFCLFLLSVCDVTNPNYGFGTSTNDDVSRLKKASDYADAQGIESVNYHDDYCYWATRSPYYDSYDCARIVDATGNLNWGTKNVDFSTGTGVAPAIIIQLN